MSPSMVTWDRTLRYNATHKTTDKYACTVTAYRRSPAGPLLAQYLHLKDAVKEA